MITKKTNIKTITFIDNKEVCLMNIVELLIKLYVAGYLLFLFNPFRSKTQITPHERKLIFDAAIYLLITVVPYKSILGLK